MNQFNARHIQSKQLRKKVNVPKQTYQKHLKSKRDKIRIQTPIKPKQPLKPPKPKHLPSKNKIKTKDNRLIMPYTRPKGIPKFKTDQSHFGDTKASFSAQLPFPKSNPRSTVFPHSMSSSIIPMQSKYHENAIKRRLKYHKESRCPSKQSMHPKNVKHIQTTEEFGFCKDEIEEYIKQNPNWYKVDGGNVLKNEQKQKK